MSTYDEHLPHLVRGTDDIYWVGFADRKVGFSNNPYLIVDGNEAMLIDPGSRAPEHYRVVHNKVAKVLRGDFEKIKYMMVQHQDPDLCAALPLFEVIVNPEVKIYAQSRSALFLRYYGVNSEVVPIEDGDEFVFESGRKLTFITTPYVHFAGSHVTYDHKTKSLFSSDIFGGFSINWSLYANKYYLEAFKAFTEPYIGSKEALLSALEKISAFEIERILPQHGSIIDEDIDKYIEAAKNLEVAQWL